MTEQEPAQTVPSRKRAWIFFGVALVAVIALAYGVSFYLASILGEPPVKSVDEIDVAQIDRLAVVVLNRPDKGPDISREGKDPLELPAEFHESVLKPLRGGQAITGKREVYLGLMQVRFRDGRYFEVKLHRVGDDRDPEKPAILQYRIGRFAYSVGPVTEFLKALDIAEGKVKGRRF